MLVLGWRARKYSWKPFTSLAMGCREMVPSTTSSWPEGRCTNVQSVTADLVNFVSGLIFQNSELENLLTEVEVDVDDAHPA